MSSVEPEIIREVDVLREQIKVQTKEFLKSGGKITKVPVGKSGIEYNGSIPKKKRFQSPPKPKK